MKSLKKYIKAPRLLCLRILLRYFMWLPDKTYLKIRFKLEMGYKLNLRSPQTFQEKLQWLKLYNRKAEYTAMVDKYAVKEYVSNKIGDQHIVPTLAVWDRVEEIDFKSLPEQFVLKTTHGGGGGGIVICTDKSTLNETEILDKLRKSMNGDIYKSYREWPYKDVPRRIIAEQLIETPSGTELTDFKFFCFNGEPKFLKVDFGRFKEHHANYYDLNWNLLPFGEADYPPCPGHFIIKPQNFDQMIEIARELSSVHKFLRVDLYNIEGKIYFGELTFYPAAGMGKFTPGEWDLKIGQMLNLN